MAGKIIVFPSVPHASRTPQIDDDEIATAPPDAPTQADDDEIADTCLIIALGFASGKLIPEIAEERGLEETVITEVLQSELNRMCSAADRLRYQLLVTDC